MTNSDYIEKYYPKYYSCQRIARWNYLNLIVEKEGEYEDIMEDLGIDTYQQAVEEHNKLEEEILAICDAAPYKHPMRPERFTFIKKISFNYPSDHQQEVNIYWDNDTNVSISLDASHMEQCKNFTHPYTGEVINYGDHKEF